LLGGCGGGKKAADVAPTVQSVTPTAGATAVAVATLITATFSEAMNPTTISTSTFTVAGPAGAPVTGTVSISGNTATFTPAALLAGNSLYTATIGTGVTDTAGTALATNFVWSFTTATIPTVLFNNPVNGAVNAVLPPGTYLAAGGAFLLTGSDLTLDAQGDANAIWVFQASSSLTVGAGGAPRSIVLINGAQAKNVFWRVGSSAMINAAGGGTMVGTIIAGGGVTISTPGNSATVTLNGRALRLNQSVTMVNTVVNVPAP
jgi:hypothetical protein